MAGDPQVVFGLPAYNHADTLPETLESLLSQTVGDFRIIISDDSSTDETPSIAGKYAALDSRITYRRLPERSGYISNARRTFREARETFPDAPFFAWASDHDLWHPAWIERLTEAFVRNPRTVAVFPWSYRIDPDGTVVRQFQTSFDIGETDDPVKRLVRTFRQLSAGNMIYGLFRAETVEKVGGLKWHLVPDRLFLCEMALHGDIVCVPEFLWSRRYRNIASLDRQRAASFSSETPPRHLSWPWWFAHAVALWKSYGQAGPSNPPLNRGQARLIAVRYAWMGLRYDIGNTIRGRSRHVVKAPLQQAQKTFRRSAKRSTKWIDRRLKEARRAIHISSKRTRKNLRNFFVKRAPKWIAQRRKDLRSFFRNRSKKKRS